RIKISATDLGDESLSVVTDVITVTNVKQQPAVVKIGEVEGSLNGKPGKKGFDELNGETLTISDLNGNPLDLSDMTLTVFPKAGLEIGAYGTVTVTKAGKYSIKIAPNDGGGKPVTATFEVVDN
ncbi:MAG: hypothetical protein K6F34_00915, partial [Lachnospiraceae bacterium]|nr:hypothetical protein [Lachnospiraceae bacterium]